MMQDSPPKRDVLDILQAPKHHDLNIQPTIMPDWEWGWISRLPYIGGFLKRVDLWFILLRQYNAQYEEVADFVAEDLEIGREARVGMEVGYKQKKLKDT
jgi:hypothetical protein